MTHSQTPNKRKRVLLLEEDPLIDPQLLLPDSSKRSRVDEVSLPVFRFNDEEIELPVVSKMDEFYALNEPKRKREAGRLSTTCLRTGRPQVIILVMSKERFTIGRREKNSYPIPEQPQTMAVSGYHAEIHAFESDTEEVVTCYEDISKTGTLINGLLVCKETVILTDGDKLRIGPQIFTYKHTAPKGHHNDSSTQSDKTRHWDPVQVGNRFIVKGTSLGSGTFSVVQLAVDNQTKKQVACKIIKRERLAKDHTLAREIKLMQKLDHPNINKMIYADTTDPERIYIFMQLVIGGDLFSYIVREGALTDGVSKIIAYQLFLALEYLHVEMKISHRDLKPENIMCQGGQYPRVLITDFGTATMAIERSKTICGTFVYHAPEVVLSRINGTGYDGKAFDCFSIGIVIYECLTGGAHPFKDELDMQTSTFGDYDEDEDLDAADIEARKEERENDKLAVIVLDCQIPFPYDLFDSIDPDAVETLKGLLRYSPLDRTTMAEALTETWIAKSLVELIHFYANHVLKRS